MECPDSKVIPPYRSTHPHLIGSAGEKPTTDGIRPESRVNTSIKPGVVKMLSM